MPHPSLSLTAMLPDMFFHPFRNGKSRDKKTKRKEIDEEERHICCVPFHHRDTVLPNHTIFSLRSHNNIDSDGRKLKRMARKVSNLSDLIQRVTASCFLHPLAGISTSDDVTIADEEEDYENEATEEEEEEKFMINSYWDGVKNNENHLPRVMELHMLMNQVFDAASMMKRAYASLQEAYCPWDPEKLRVADVAVVAELRRLGLLRERFRRGIGGSGGRDGRWRLGAATLREVVVAPYEAAVEELKREVKAQQVEIGGLREKLKTATSFDRMSGMKGKSKRRLSSATQVAAAPAMELFESTMSIVKEASKSFTSLLLSLMHSARWDIAAAVRSIEAASCTTATTKFTDSIVGTSHAKYAIESYVTRKMFQGFDHETFYMDGSLSSLLHPDQHRRDCFIQYRDMKAMNPVGLLSILPTCSFGNFCFKKYLSIVHPKMEESLFGNLEQRRLVLKSHHPRSRFYRELLGLAKAVWLLHLLAFSLDPPPSHFEATKGAEFHSQYMESVVRVSRNNGGPKVGAAMVVGIPVSPGFKLGNGSIIKARVYLVPDN